MKQLIQIPASVVDMRPRSDKSWVMKFETRELQPDEVALLAEHFQGEGWLVYKPNNEVTADELPEDTAEIGTKRPSQRLRAVIYRYWEANGKVGDFESFYRVQMEKLIDYVKERLP